MSTYETILRIMNNLSTYETILCIMNPNVDISVYNAQYGFTCLHMTYIAQSNSICHHCVSQQLKLLGTLKIMAQAFSEPCQTSKMERFAEIVNGFQFRKMLHLRCLTGI